MILVYHLGSADNDWVVQRNIDFLQRIKNNAIEGVVSTFTMTEAVSVIEEQLANQRRRVPAAAERQQVLARITQLVNSLGLEVVDSDELVAIDEETGLFARTQAVIDTTPPVQSPRDGKWTLLGGADAIHVALAERAHADKLATFDKSIRPVQSSVSIEILGDRP